MRDWADTHRWILGVLGVALGLAGATLLWDDARLLGYPLQIDEAGYLSIAENDRIGFQSEGIHKWAETVLNQAPFAPLVPAMTSPPLVINQSNMQGFGARLLPRPAHDCGVRNRRAHGRSPYGALAAIVVASMPGVANFSRTYVFALPAAALMACVVFSLMRAERMQRSGWAIAAGAAIGAMLLARTMTVAFVPGILVAAVVPLACRPGSGLRRGLLNLGLLCVAAFAVAAPWYLHNLDSVVDYLTEFGYGERSAEYGTSHSIVSWDWWTDVFSRLVSTDLFLLLAVLVVVGLAAVLVAAVRRVAEAEHRSPRFATCSRATHPWLRSSPVPPMSRCPHPATWGSGSPCR